MARLRGSGSVIAAKTDWSAEEGETETVPVKAATRGVVSSRARPSEYIHIYRDKCIRAEKYYYDIYIMSAAVWQNKWAIKNNKEYKREIEVQHSLEILLCQKKKQSYFFLIHVKALEKFKVSRGGGRNLPWQ